MHVTDACLLHHAVSLFSRRLGFFCNLLIRKKKDRMADNREEDVRIKKKFRKNGLIYRCCDAPSGNCVKHSGRYRSTCTYPQVGKRREITLENIRIVRMLDDICLWSLASQ